MLGRIIGTASVMRHGATGYTGIFPDLLEEGLPALKLAGKEIAERFPKKPRFVASPAKRAIASALHVMEAYGLARKTGAVQIEESLRPISIFDQRAIRMLVKGLGGLETVASRRAWDRFYMESEEFDRGFLCESRSSAKARFVEFVFGRLPHLCDVQHHVIAVTHVELVGCVIQDWFEVGEDYFRPAEVAHFSFFTGRQLQVEFRGQTKVLKI